MLHRKLKILAHRDHLYRKFQKTRDINDWHAYKDAHKSTKMTFKNAEKKQRWIVVENN